MEQTQPPNATSKQRLYNLLAQAVEKSETYMKINALVQIIDNNMELWVTFIDVQLRRLCILIFFYIFFEMIINILEII
jgi:hypothetical protein